MPLTLWPSKKQFKNWSIPSKLTCISAYISGISLLLTVILGILPYCGSEPATKADVAEVKANVAEFRALILEDKIDRPRLDADYPLGYVLLYADLEHLRQIKREGVDLPNTQIIANWSTARVISMSKRTIEIMLPKLRIQSQRSSGIFYNNQIMIRRKERERTQVPIRLPGIILWIEVLKNNSESLILLVGVQPI